MTTKKDWLPLLINETPHYSVTFISLDHLQSMATKDDLIHPLGTVYRSKETDIDNNIRIVLVNGFVKKDGSLGAFLFDKNIWHHKKNPFSPSYESSVGEMVSDSIEKFEEKILQIGKLFSFA